MDKNCLSELSRNAALDLEASRPEVDNPSFPERLIAAWAASGDEPLSAAAASALVDDTHRRHITSNAQVRADIGIVRDQLEDHPLALAALASAWREDGYDKHFWRRAARAIAARDRDAIPPVDPDLYRGEVIARRQEDAVSAVRFAWDLLDTSNRERYLDLVVLPRNEPIDEMVFDEMWQRIDAGGEKLRPQMARRLRPLEIFASRSLLRPAGSSGAYKLHDLHRLLIERLLRERSPSAISDRHRDLLSITGFIGGDGVFALAESRHFRTLGGQRTVLWPELWATDDDSVPADAEDDGDDEVTSSERRAVGTHFLKHLPHHLRELARSAAEAEILSDTLFTTFGYLQALLDDHRSPERHTQGDYDLSGNVAYIVARLLAAKSPDASLLARTIRAAARILSQDRLQLAFQLVARLRRGHSLRIDALIERAAQNIPRPALVPRFSFMSGATGSLIASFDADAIPFHGGVSWVPDVFGSPAILVVSTTGELSLWNTSHDRKRLPLSLDREWSDCTGASWLAAGVYGKPAVLTWHHDGHVRLRDPFTGEGLTRETMKHDSAADGAIWIDDAFGSPGILSWSRDGAIAIWDGHTGARVVSDFLKEVGPITDVAWFRDGEGRLGIFSRGPRSVSLWNPATGERCYSEVAAYPSTRSQGSTWVTWFGAHVYLDWDQYGRVSISEHDQVPPHDSPLAENVHHAIWVDDPARGPLRLVATWNNSLTLLDADLESPRVLFQARHPGGADLHVSWAPNAFGQPAILSWDDDGFVHLWDPSARANDSIAQGAHPDKVLGLVWRETPSGVPVIVSWSTDGKFVTWNPATGRRRGMSSLRPPHIESEAAHAIWINDSRAGAALLVLEKGGSVSQFDLVTGSRINMDPEHGMVHSLQWIDDAALGSRLLYQDWSGRICVLKWETSAVEISHGGSILGAAWTNELLPEPVVVSWDDDRFRLWDPTTGAERHLADGKPESLEWSVDDLGRGVISFGPTTDDRRPSLRPREGNDAYDKSVMIKSATKPKTLSRTSHQIELLDAASGQRILPEPIQHAARIVEATLLEDRGASSFILGCSTDRSLRLWDATTGVPQARFDLDAIPSVVAVYGQASGLQVVAIGFDDGSIGVFDLVR